MAEDLKSLVGAGRARELQEKLESWHQDYGINSWGENLNKCCEILELNTAIQKQLFTILNETSREDSHNEGAETIKNRLLPSLGTCFSCGASGGENNLSLTQDLTGEEMQLGELASTQTCRLQELEEKLTSTRLQIKQMEQDLKASHAEEKDTLRKLERLNDCEQQIQILQDEISILDAQKSVLQSRLARSCSPHRCSGSKSRISLSLRSWSPARARRVNASRRACLIARFGFIYAQERLDAEICLRTFISDMETVQRIIYLAAVESFHAAKMAFWKLKIRVKETLSLDHVGPGSLEDAALDYIICHRDLYVVHTSVHEVIHSMNISPKISLPPGFDLIVIGTLIRELCSLAFSMQTLVPPLDIAFGVDGEPFDKTMYYRSFDSDFTADFVAYHIWPALMENSAVIVKGEVVTKRMVLLTRSRSVSTLRITTSNR